MRNALVMTTAVLALGSAATLAFQSPAGAQAAAAVNVAPAGAPRSFADLTARLQPAVVNVSTTSQVEVGRASGITPGSPLDELFRRFQEQQGGDGQPVTREAKSLGSGFIISSDGYIVTNNHVVSGRDGIDPVATITITMSDRREYTARIVGRDTLADLALLKIDAKDLPFVQFGDSSKVRVGDWAIAIGNPFGLGGTVTAGIVSALHRNISSGSAYDRYLQTDASINQGNSGGPLFDLDGNVVGINTVIFTPSGGNIGLGFAIPAEVARPVIEQLRAAGRVRRGYLGVTIQPVTDDIAAGLGLPKGRGEIVTGTEPSGPAGKAGLKQGDVIVKVNGKDVTQEDTLQYLVSNSRIGSTVPIEFIRGGKRQTISITLGERPSDQQLASSGTTPEAENGGKPQPTDTATRASLGITLQPLNAEIRRQLNIGDTVQGVVIASVNPSSDAAAQGLRRGDIILSINQQQTTTPSAAAAAVAAARAANRDTVLILVQRGTAPARFAGVKMAPVDSVK